MPSLDYNPDKLHRRIHMEPRTSEAVQLPPQERTHRKIYFGPQEKSPSETADQAPTSAPVEQDTDSETAKMEAFKLYLRDAPPELLEAAQHNISVLYDLFTDRIQPSHLRDGAPATFAHAGTGERVSVQDAQDQTEQPISPDLQKAMGQAISKLTGE